jgi:NADPH:quinone reductase-like Zn-dependent oxidoreductase
MRAFRYHAARPTTRPSIEDVPVPPLAPGELLVRVDCASLNPVDWKIATGHFRLLVKGGLPRTMGSDFAGRVAGVGPGVTGWSVEEPVMGFIDPFARSQGTFAEFVAVPAGFAYRRPASIDERLGAALPCVGITAVALCDRTRIGPGSNVLVNGASGGVGHLALQIARARGARVTAVASSGRRAFLNSLGVDAFIDYTTVAPGDWPGRFDAVLDCVPNLPRHTHARLLARGGHYASTLPNAATFMLDPLTNRLGRLVRHAIMLRPNESAMRELIQYVEQGRLRCEIAEEFPLEAAMQAIEASRAGHVAGKLVIRVTGPDS